MITLLTWMSLSYAGSCDHTTNLADLFERSDSVVHGVVVLAESSASGRGLRTEVTIVVEDVLAGPERYELQLTLPGGRVGRLQETVGGVPNWEEGDEVVVFVPRDGGTDLRGLFTVEHGQLLDPMSQREKGFPMTLAALRQALHR